MSWYHVTLVLVGVVAMALAWRVPRAKWWAAGILAAYLLPVFYMYAPEPEFIPWMPPVAGISFMCDASLYLAIREFHKERWEMDGLGRLFMLSATLDLVQTLALTIGFPPPMSSTIYGSLLEIINLVAFLSIFGMGLMDRVRGGGFGILDRYIHRLDLACRYAHQKTKCTQPLRKW